MPGKSYAVLIGINEYEDNQDFAPLRFAEKDCADMYHVLTDPKLGRFLPENTRMITGSDATTRNIEEALYTFVVKDRTPEDTILVYFSGHGFLAGDRGFAYLATYDVHIKSILRNPSAGLRMNRVFEDYFMISSAKNVIFIVDCCHSGALTPMTSREVLDPETRGLIDKRLYTNSSGRMALVACPPDAVSRESSELQNGIFTHYILRGIKGEAIEFDTGEVTLDSLLSFVRIHAPAEQPPGSYGQYYGRIVLSAPAIKQKDLQRDKIANVTSTETLVPVPLFNPLETFVPTIQDLLNLLNLEVNSTDVVDKRILESICRAIDAEYAFVLRLSNNEWFVKSFGSLDKDTEVTPPIAVSRAISIISNSQRPQFKYQDLYYLYSDNANSEKAILVVNLLTDKDYMVLYGIKRNMQSLGDVFPKVLRSIYMSTRELTLLQPIVVEAGILDVLKADYGYVPTRMYDRRLEIFTSRLSEIIIHFEPILYLEPNNLYISGWEALARDPVSLTAPIDLFNAAQLWGKRFITDLDKSMLQKALLSYRQALREAKAQRPYEIQDLSVNVYPETLMRSAYVVAIREGLRESGLISSKLHLEISEKSAIPDEAGTISAFKRRLTDIYIRDLRIGGFIIDDFGVGHSSVSRLARLEPEYIKVDRDVLLHGYTEVTLRFVLELATQNRLRFPKVVIEGFDGSGPVSLRDLYDIGIRYVQGYHIGKAKPTLYRLDKETASILGSQLNTLEGIL